LKSRLRIFNASLSGVFQLGLAVLGGVAMSGGVGTLGGALIGLLIMQGFNNGLMMLNIPSFWQTVSRGLLLIAALSFDYVRNRKSKLKNA
jgi:ribose transport system permease protein